jgi:cytochrome c biogenesis protein CcdA
MIITLGVAAILRVLRKRADVHLHRHSHEGRSHVHIHFHEPGAEHAGDASTHSHAISQIGFKPLWVGVAHGLAGSAALTLLVLAQIHSVLLGLLYLALFGLGSTLGMLAMSGLIGLPFALGARRRFRVSFGLQAIAGALSIAFGLWYAYESGVANNLWQSLL